MCLIDGKLDQHRKSQTVTLFRQHSVTVNTSSTRIIKPTCKDVPLRGRLKQTMLPCGRAPVQPQGPLWIEEDLSSSLSAAMILFCLPFSRALCAIIVNASWSDTCGKAQ